MGKYFCPMCLKTIRFYSPLINPEYKKIPYIDGLFVLAHYDGVIRKAILEVKYHGKFAIFSEIVQMFPEKLNFDFNYLVPVPLSKEREFKRGFNQSEKLAEYLNYELRSMNYATKILNCLERTRDTPPQFDLCREKRLENVKGAFSHNSKFIIHNSIVCLMDDVCTTGATLSECAKVLKEAGAKKVYAICLARGN